MKSVSRCLRVWLVAEEHWKNNMNIHYEDGYCSWQNDGKSFILFTSNKLEVLEFDEGGTYASVEMYLPSIIADAIREGFKKETEK